MMQTASRDEVHPQRSVESNQVWPYAYAVGYTGTSLPDLPEKFDQVGHRQSDNSPQSVDGPVRSCR